MNIAQHTSMTNTAAKTSLATLCADFTGDNFIDTCLDTNKMPWLQSQFNGLKYKTLRSHTSANSAQKIATCLVKIEPGFYLEQDNLATAKEILVIDGTLNDEHRKYPKGSYLRYPAKHARSLYSPDGCTVFLKSNEFQRSDLMQAHLNTQRASLFHKHSPCHQSLCLHEHKNEAVYIHHCKAGASHQASYRHGIEVYIIEGRIRSAGTVFGGGYWLQKPANTTANWVVLDDSKLWVKEGHLALVSS